MAGLSGLPQGEGLGYPHELWTTRLLARHAREHGPAEGHACLGKLVQGTVCKILNEQEVKPHKVRYYLERRDPEFKEKMAEVLCVYRQVKILKESAAQSKTEPNAVAIVSYDEKPGIQVCRPQTSFQHLQRDIYGMISDAKTLFLGVVSFADFARRGVPTRKLTHTGVSLAHGVT